LHNEVSEVTHQTSSLGCTASCHFFLRLRSQDPIFVGNSQSYLAKLWETGKIYQYMYQLSQMHDEVLKIEFHIAR
jgi:hypothetical protein